MSKNLLYAFSLMLFCNLMVAQQAKQGAAVLIESTPNTIINGQAGKAHRSGVVAAPTTTTSTCASLNFPAPSTWTLQSYGYGTGNGYVNGTNIYGDLEKAAYFDASASSFTLLNQVYVQFAVGKGTNLNKVVSMIIYDGTSGTPGAAIGTSSMTLGDIKADIASGYYTSFVFSGGVTLPASKKFFTSVDMSALTWTTTVKDSLSIVSNKNGQSVPPPTWERASDNNWYQYNTAGATTASVSLVMFPFLTNTPSAATFSVSSNPVCANQSITYNAAGTAFDASNTSNLLIWTFSGPAGTSTLQSNMAPVQTPTVAGTYTTVLEVLGGGCSVYEYAIQTITVNALPSLTATPASTAVCVGTNISLSGSGATTYTWTGGVTNGVSFTPTSTNYTVTGTAPNGCTNTAVASVTVNTLPNVTATPASTAVCAGTNITLTGGGSATIFTWTSGITNGASFAPASADYTVTGMDANGCVNTAVASVTVNTLPNVTATPASTTVCAGIDISLTGGGSATTYTWTGGVIDGSVFTPISTDYTVTGTDVNGCSNTAIASVTVNSAPAVAANATSTMVCTGDQVTLSGAGATSYSWTTGVMDNTPFSPASTDTYTVTGTDVNGCSATATVEVVVSTCTGIQSLSNATTGVIVFPNPNSGEFAVKSQKSDVINLTNELGQVINTFELTQENNFSTNITGLQSGIYFLVGKSVKQKVIVTK